MNKKLFFKMSIFLPVLSMTACGYSLRELYDGSAYNDTVFVNNFYKEWNPSIKAGSDKISSITNIELDKDKDFVFTKFDDSNFKDVCEKDATNKYSYEDLSRHSKDELPVYGDSNKLSSIDSSFRYGYISKLFDGQMFCDGDFQLARVQIDEEGFGSLFTKELSYNTQNYFAMNFKASLDYTVHPFTATAKSKITLTVGFYMKDGNSKYSLKNVSYTLDAVQTNTSDSHDYSCYTFFGFSLRNIDIDRCCGISVTYKLLDITNAKYYDKDLNKNVDMSFEKIKEEGIAHSLMIYEVLLPHSVWH